MGENTTGGDVVELVVDEVALRRRVELEIGLRGLSARKCSQMTGGSPSNSVWSKWLAGDAKLGNALKAAVAVVFDWPTDWWLNPPPLDLREPGDPTLRELNEKLDQVLEILGRMAAQNAELADVLAAPSRRPNRR
jgi:hypothetical protein